MGTSVCAYHIRDRAQTECLDALAKVKSPPAYVSSETDHWLSVVDENSQAFKLEALENTIANVSRVLGSDVLLTAVYDNEVSLYVAFHAGSEIDRYSSSSDIFEWLDRKIFLGNLDELSKAFTWWQGKKDLELSLKKKYKRESMRLKDIVRAFGISEERAFRTFRDLVEPLPPALLATLSPKSQLAGYVHKVRQGYVEFKK